MSAASHASFVDSATIEVASGRGGDGASHMRREKYAPRGGPDGGDGGRGGDVILSVHPNLRTLVDFRFRRKFIAEDGDNGGTNDCTGASGDDVIVPVPAGTLVYDDDTGRLVVDLSDPGQTHLVCRGGRGGHGNAFYVTAANQITMMRELGEPGQARNLRLELKLLADAALVGFPNAGKSTLISRLSAAKPKIANYPFTTLTPNLGVVRLDDGASFVVADLPGLIEGAADGKGLGHEFLRHLERARVIVHLLDLSGFERPDPVADYKTIRAELESYDERLAHLPELVVGTKLDLVDDHDLVEIVQEELEPLGVERILPVSAVTGWGVPELLAELSAMVFSARADSVVAQQAEVEQAEAEADTVDDDEDDSFEVLLDADEEVFVVAGRVPERLVAMCDLENEEAVMHLHRMFMRMGIIAALREAGCEDGMVVRIGGIYLDFME
ncbi:MAG: GTPase ObgE [Armatimonadetes bacterium]|nr:GTPase ObgE [Armatimonadota bacterium]